VSECVVLLGLLVHQFIYTALSNRTERKKRKTKTRVIPVVWYASWEFILLVWAPPLAACVWYCVSFYGVSVCSGGWGAGEEEAADVCSEDEETGLLREHKVFSRRRQHRRPPRRKQKKDRSRATDRGQAENPDSLIGNGPNLNGAPEIIS
jgi:hypothetical protein